MSQENFLANFVLAATSATISKLLFAPYENIKRRGVHHPSLTSIRATGYFSYLTNCALQIAKTEGISALFFSNFRKNIFYYSRSQALNFSLKDLFRKILNNYDSNANPYKWSISNFISGGLAGVCSLIIMYPLDTPKVRWVEILMASQQKQYKVRSVLYIFLNFRGS